MTNTFTPPPLSLARLDELAAMAERRQLCDAEEVTPFVILTPPEAFALISLAREALRLRAAVAAMGEEFPAVNGRQPQCPECFRLGGYEPHDTDCSRGRFFLKLAYLQGTP